MSLTSIHKDVQFGVGDRIRVHLKIKEADRERTTIFEGMLIAIKNKEGGRTIMVRRIGEAGVGIERIFPLASPFLEKIEVVKKGTEGVRHSKLYYTREKAPREVDEIYSRIAKKASPKKEEKPKKKIHARKKRKLQ